MPTYILLSNLTDEGAKALKAKNAKDILTAVKNVNASCNNCHGVFRD